MELTIQSVEFEERRRGGFVTEWVAVVEYTNEALLTVRAPDTAKLVDTRQLGSGGGPRAGRVRGHGRPRDARRAPFAVRQERDRFRTGLEELRQPIDSRRSRWPRATSHAGDSLDSPTIALGRVGEPGKRRSRSRTDRQCDPQPRLSPCHRPVQCRTRSSSPTQARIERSLSVWLRSCAAIGFRSGTARPTSWVAGSGTTRSAGRSSVATGSSSSSRRTPWIRCGWGENLCTASRRTDSKVASRRCCIAPATTGSCLGSFPRYRRSTSQADSRTAAASCLESGASDTLRLAGHGADSGSVQAGLVVAEPPTRLLTSVGTPSAVPAEYHRVPDRTRTRR